MAVEYNMRSITPFMSFAGQSEKMSTRVGVWPDQNLYICYQGDDSISHVAAAYANAEYVVASESL